MARHYYLTRSGRLKRKDNTLLFELSGDAAADEVKLSNEIGEAEIETEFSEKIVSNTEQNLGADSLDEFTLERKPKS